MAGVMVRLEMGTGFSSTEWAELEKTVDIDAILAEGAKKAAAKASVKIREASKAAGLL